MNRSLDNGNSLMIALSRKVLSRSRIVSVNDEGCRIKGTDRATPLGRNKGSATCMGFGGQISRLRISSQRLCVRPDCDSQTTEQSFHFGPQPLTMLPPDTRL